MKEEFSFSKNLEQVNTIINGQCRDKNIAYDCIIIGNVDDYYIGDSMKLKQILINILGNAVKFTPEGGKVGFTIEEVNKNEKKAVLKFVISDNGIGMSEEYLPHLFDAFSQEDSSATNTYGSTGLGMPEMDGLEATKAIRSSGREDAKAIPVIALTANAFDEDVERSMQAGLNAHLSKPVDPELLFETLETLIK